MHVERAIYGILSGDATLTNLVGDRIFTENATQETPNPCIVYTETGTPNATKSGVSTLDEIMLQVDVYGDTPQSRNTVGSRVRFLLDRYAGTINGVVIQQIDFMNEWKLYDDESNAYRSSMDFTVRQVL